MIKIPATLEGLPAITAVLAEGVNVNVTLIFSLARYAEVIDAWLEGLELAAANGHDLASIWPAWPPSSSRASTPRSTRCCGEGDPRRGTTANAQAARAYQLYRDRVGGERVARAAGRRRPGPATPVGVDVGEEPRLRRAALRGLAGRRRDGQHDARRDAGARPLARGDVPRRSPLLEATPRPARRPLDRLDGVDGSPTRSPTDSRPTAWPPSRRPTRSCSPPWRPSSRRPAVSGRPRDRVLGGDADALRRARPRPRALGWLRHRERYLGPWLDEVDARRPRRHERAILLGMGGSSSPARLYAEARPGNAPVVLDTIEPRHDRRDRVREATVIASSKSGTTIETQTLLAHALRPTVWTRPTWSSSPTRAPLAELAAASAPTRARGPRDRGRFSGLSPFGLVPALYAGWTPDELRAELGVRARRRAARGGGGRAPRRGDPRGRRVDLLRPRRGPDRRRAARSGSTSWSPRRPARPGAAFVPRVVRERGVPRAPRATSER